jgi:hypothetical protein
MHRLILGVMIMKRFFLGIATLLALTFSVASSALTLEDFTGSTDDSGVNDTGAQYVTLSDTIYPASAPMYRMKADLSALGANYVIGIFGPGPGGDELTVLDSAAGIYSSNVLFDVGAGTVEALVRGVATDTANIGTTFGFFLKIYDAGGGLTNSYYSDDPSDVFSLFYSPSGFVSTEYADLGLGIGDPLDTGDLRWSALITVDDVRPVPLPAAAWLFGSAILGLLGLGGRRKAATGASA